MVNTVKIPAEIWIETAKQALIDFGLSGVKVERLAKTLNVTRGGFYHHFENHADLLDSLLEHWSENNELIPLDLKANTQEEALTAFEDVTEHIIAEAAFSPAFELAIREWARIDLKVKQKVDEIDESRIERLTDLYVALGCDQEEAEIRANVFYFHQIGFFSLGRHDTQSKEKRMKAAGIYLRILCGRHYVEGAELRSKKWT